MTSGLTKIIQLDAEFEHTGEPRVRYIDPRDTHLAMHKYASSGALDYIRHVDPLPGHRIVLVLAMSAWEYYGPNRNGDGFSERGVCLPGINGGLPVIDMTETLPAHHKSFETTAHNFLHHVNKDPAKAVGKVMQSFYNWDMHRVELLLAVDEIKAPKICQRIVDGEYPGVSMGCRIKYDVCTICGNRAPTRAQYCEHVSGHDPQYGMNTILPDGRQCAVLNPSPQLFDISWVWRPADRVGFMLKKVASTSYEVLSADLGEKIAEENLKTSALHKLSLMDKYIDGEIPTLTHDNSVCGCADTEMTATERVIDRLLPGYRQNFEPLPQSIIDAGARHGVRSFTSSLNAVGVYPTVQETYRVICRRNGLQPMQIIELLLPAMRAAIVDAFQDVPSFFDLFESELGPTQSSVRRELVERVMPYVEKRALYKEYLLRNHVSPDHAYMAPLLGADESALFRPTHQVLHAKDPTTGRNYETTRGVAEETDWENTKKNLTEAGLIAAASSGLAALAATRKGGSKMLAVPILGGGGVMSAALATADLPTIRTEEGVDIPVNAPMVEKRSASMRPITNMDAFSALAMDPYIGPLAGGGLAAMILGSENIPLGPPELRNFAQENPLLVAGAGAVGLGSLRGLLKRGAYRAKQAGVHYSGDPVAAPYLEVDVVLEKLAMEWTPILSNGTYCDLVMGSVK